MLGNLHMPWLQTLFDGLGRFQKRQQTGKVGAGTVGEPRDVFGECVELLTAGDDSAHPPGLDLRLHRYPGRDLDVGHQFRQRLTDPAAQRLQLPTERPDPGEAVRAVALRGTRVHQRVTDPGLIDHVGGQHRIQRFVEFLATVHRTRRPVAGGHREFPGTAPQRVDVLGAQLPTRTGQQPHRRRPGKRIGHQPQHRDDVGDLRNMQQPTDTHHFRGDTAGGERGGQRRRILVAAHQNRGRRRCLPGLFRRPVPVLDAVGHPLAFVDDVVAQSQSRDPGGRAVPGAQHAHRNTSAAQLLRRLVGQLQGGPAVTPARQQFQPPRLRAVRPSEVPGEPGQIGGRCAAPTVDRLDRITHRGDRDRRRRTFCATAEQRGQQDSLRMSGVLVLVEQHRPHRRPFGVGDLRMSGHQPRRHRHLRPEIQCRLPAHLVAQRHYQRHQLPALVDHRLDLAQRLTRLGALTRPLREGVDQPVQGVAGGLQRRHVHQVFGQFRIQRQHRLGHRRRGLVGDELTRPVRHHRERQLPQFGLRQQRRGRFHRQQQSVVGDQPARIRVIGAHLGVGAAQPGRQRATGIPGAQRRRPGQHRQSAPDPRPQLTGRLAGERQTKNLLRTGQLIGHQPHHPRGHRLRFARTRSRHHQHRFHRCLDDGDLLVRRRRQAESGGQ